MCARSARPSIQSAWGAKPRQGNPGVCGGLGPKDRQQATYSNLSPSAMEICGRRGRHEDHGRLYSQTVDAPEDRQAAYVVGGSVAVRCRRAPVRGHSSLEASSGRRQNLCASAAVRECQVHQFLVNVSGRPLFSGFQVLCPPHACAAERGEIYVMAGRSLGRPDAAPANARSSRTAVHPPAGPMLRIPETSTKLADIVRVRKHWRGFGQDWPRNEHSRLELCQRWPDSTRFGPKSATLDQQVAQI